MKNYSKATNYKMSDIKVHEYKTIPIKKKKDFFLTFINKDRQYV